jgi:hypothetical protein
MFYFKNEPLPPSQIDPEQLRQVQRFRTDLANLGSLYWNFNTVEEFQNLVRVHLSRVVQDWAHASVGTLPTAPPAEEPAKRDVQPSAQAALDQEEEGLLDLVDQANDAFAKLTEVTGRMTAAVEEIGEKMVQRTKEIEDLHPELGSYDVKAAKRIAARAAADLNEYVARTEVDIPIFAEAFATAIGSLGRAASISMEFDRRDTEDLEDLLGNAQSLRQVMTQSSAQLHSFRDSIAGMPRVTSALNRAKRAALSTMDSLLREFDVGTAHVSEVEQSLQQIIQRFQGRDGEHV